MEQRAEVLMRSIKTNSKKISQAKLKTQAYHIRRMQANLRIMQELCKILNNSRQDDRLIW